MSELSGLGIGNPRPVGNQVVEDPMTDETQKIAAAAELRAEREAAQAALRSPKPSGQAQGSMLAQVLAAVVAGATGAGVDASKPAFDAAGERSQQYNQVQAAQQLEEYNAKVKPATDYMKFRMELSDKLMNIIQTNPDSLVGVPADVLSELATLGAMKMDPGRKGSEAIKAIRLKAQLDDLDDRIRMAKQPEERARLLDIRGQILSADDPEYMKKIGPANAEAFRDNKLPPFGTVVHQWGQRGAELYAQAQLTNDVSSFYAGVRTLPPVVKPTRTMNERARLSAMISEIQERALENEEVVLTDDQAIDRLDSNHKRLARKHWPLKADKSLAQSQAAVQRALRKLPEEFRNPVTNLVTEEGWRIVHQMVAEEFTNAEEVQRKTADAAVKQSIVLGEPPPAQPPRLLQSDAATAKLIEDRAVELMMADPKMKHADAVARARQEHARK